MPLKKYKFHDRQLIGSAILIGRIKKCLYFAHLLSSLGKFGVRKMLLIMLYVCAFHENQRGIGEAFLMSINENTVSWRFCLVIVLFLHFFALFLLYVTE
jgi:hypothetical protein